MGEPINFANQQEIEADVSCVALGSLGLGTLRFGPKCWPEVNFDPGSSSLIWAMPEGKIHRALKARTSVGTFTLFDCERHGHLIYAELVVLGDLGEALRRIEIHYSDISAWFNAWQRIEGNVSETITWAARTPHLATTIKTKNETFSLTTESESSITQSGEDYLLHDHVLFCFERLDAHFSPEDVQTKALQLSHLLSILIAQPLSILDVYIVCDEDQWRHPVFFPTYERVERYADIGRFKIDCFVTEQQIHDRWELIFTRYFNSNYRDVSWSRLAGMQRYEGFWEYRALGYVTLLDNYVSQRHREAPRALTKISLTIEKTAEIDSALDTLSPSLDDCQYTGLLGILHRIFGSKHASFRDRYLDELSRSDPGVIKVIDLSPEDFTLIKRVRDRIAHGKAVDVLKSDFHRIETIVARIVLLMTYWAFLDFGLTGNDFLQGLRNTFNTLRFKARPNVLELDRVINPASFLTVSKQVFDKVSIIKGIRANAFFTRDESGALEYAEKYAQAYRDWQANSKKASGITQHAEIFGVVPDRVAWISSAYIQCDDEYLETAMAWIIDES